MSLTIKDHPLLLFSFVRLDDIFITGILAEKAEVSNFFSTILYHLICFLLQNSEIKTRLVSLQFFINISVFFFCKTLNTQISRTHLPQIYDHDQGNCDMYRQDDDEKNQNQYEFKLKKTRTTYKSSEKL